MTVAGTGSCGVASWKVAVVAVVVVVGGGWREVDACRRIGWGLGWG